MDNVRITNDEPMSEGVAVTGGQTFDEFAASLPDDARTGFDTVQPGTSTDVESEGIGVVKTVEGDGDTEPRKRAVKMSKQMKAAMKKIKDKTASFPILWFKGKALIHPEWALDETEEEIIKDSITFAFDVLDINFEIEQLNVTLKSIWWVIAYPFVAISLIFFMHGAAVKEAHPEDFKKDEEPTE